jgi:8-oxo-dGTP pyrophosphatase MutT (NUDIX family)
VLDEIKHRLEAYEPREQEYSIATLRAAVLIPLYVRDGELHIVLTKRTDRVETHKGEISFPGGAMDAGDIDLMGTALRESLEEIGLLQEHVDVLGRLDDHVTATGFHITAFIGLIDPAKSPYDWVPHEFEVAEVLEVPLAHLRDRRSLIEVPRLREGETTLMEAYAFGEHIIWGATFRMLRNFIEVAFDSVDADTALSRD